MARKRHERARGQWWATWTPSASKPFSSASRSASVGSRPRYPWRSISIRRSRPPFGPLLPSLTRSTT